MFRDAGGDTLASRYFIRCGHKYQLLTFTKTDAPKGASRFAQTLNEHIDMRLLIFRGVPLINAHCHNLPVVFIE